MVDDDVDEHLPPYEVDALGGAFASAHEAAVRHEPWELVERLYETGIIGGLARTLGGKWADTLCEDDVDLAVAEAVDALYERLAAGANVLDPVGYLWKAADRKALGLLRARKEKGAPRDNDELEHGAPVPEGKPVALPRRPVEANWHLEARRDGDSVSPDFEAARALALRTARDLLGQLGMDNVQRVMTYVFDAVERGDPHLAPEQIADALDLKPSSVRVWLHRGFQRLGERAAKLGLSVPIHTSDDGDDEPHD